MTGKQVSGGNLTGRRPTDDGVLTVQMEMFVNHYFGQAKLNSVTAARLAGYSNPEKKANELLSRPAVAAEIERRLNMIAVKTNITADQIEGLLYEEATNHTEKDSSPTARVAALGTLAKIKGLLDKKGDDRGTTVVVQMNFGGEAPKDVSVTIDQDGKHVNG
jgi:hypothetical protein